MRRLAALSILAALLRFLAWLAMGHAPQDYCQWDCGWYVGLAKGGYDLVPRMTGTDYGQANWAFFPLFPALIRGGAALGLSYPVAALAVAWLGFMAFLVLACLYLCRLRPQTSPAALIAFLAVWPWGIYNTLPYTESLFAALTIAGLYFLALARPLPAAAVTALAAATRVTGVLLALPVAAQALAPAWCSWRAGQRRSALHLAAPALLPIALAPLGLFLFMAFLQAHMGDGLAFLHVQAGWQREHGFPLLILVMQLPNYFSTHGEQSIALAEDAAFVSLALCLWLARQRLWAPLWVLSTTIMLALSAGMASLPRYLFANPVFEVFAFAFAWQFDAVRRFFPLLLLAMAVLQLVFLHFWVRGYGFLI